MPGADARSAAQVVASDKYAQGPLRDLWSRSDAITSANCSATNECSVRWLWLILRQSSQRAPVRHLILQQGEYPHRVRGSHLRLHSWTDSFVKCALMNS